MLKTRRLLPFLLAATLGLIGCSGIEAVDAPSGGGELTPVKVAAAGAGSCGSHSGRL